VAMCLVVVLRYYYQIENKKREREGLEETEQDREFLDKTDRENRTFIYLL